jgi:hypothetical protein
MMFLKSPSERGLTCVKVEFAGPHNRWRVSDAQNKHSALRNLSMIEMQLFPLYWNNETFYAWANWSRVIGYCLVEPATANDWEG